MMDFKKLGLGIIILGLLVACYGLYGYLKALPSPAGEPGRPVAADMGLSEYAKDDIRKHNLPIILVGAGIMVLGGVIKFSAKKNG